MNYKICLITLSTLGTLGTLNTILKGRLVDCEKGYKKRFSIFSLWLQSAQIFPPKYYGAKKIK
jgi:hypothetical protein